MKLACVLLFGMIVAAQIGDPLNLYPKDAMLGDRVLVPAISSFHLVKRMGVEGECPSGTACTVTVRKENWTCAEGKRVLLNSEDGTEHWCLKLPASTK